MLKSRIRRHDAEGARVANCLAQIEASVAALQDEDLLDLADIFSSGTMTPLLEQNPNSVNRWGIPKGAEV